MPEMKQKITRDQIKQSLMRSGYLLEMRVEAKLRDRIGGYVAANASYQDPDTGKSRELDIYALLAEKVGPLRAYVFSAILVECIHNPQPSALLTRGPTETFLHEGAIKLSGLPVKVWIASEGRGKWVPLMEYLGA